MGTVFVTMRNDAVNLVPALSWGRLRLVVSNTNPSWTADAEGVAQDIQTVVDEYVHGRDYILPLGDPVAIGVVFAAVAMKNNGRVSVLKWDRMEQVYYPVEIELKPIEENKKNGQRF